MIDRRDPRRRRNRPTPEMLEDRRLLASLAPIANLSAPAQQGYALPLDGSGTADAQTFSITRTSGSADISASIPQGPFWTINVQYTDPTNAANDFSGPLVFQLFQTLTPNTVSQIETFTNDGYYTGKNFTRIMGGFPTANDDIVQAGAPNTNGTGSSGQPNTPFLNENAQSLAFTGTYQLAMANAGVNTSLSNASQGVNTNDTQFFVTTTGSSDAGLGYGYTIFGQLLSGQATLTKMTQVPRVYNSVYGETSLPANPIIMSSLSLSATNPSGVALIDTTQARPGDTATFQVTATDPTDGSTLTRSFIVTAGTYAGPTDPAIDFKPLADPVSAAVANGSSTNVALVGHDGYPDTNYPGTLSYSLVSQPSHGTISQFNATTGTFVYTPQAGYSGPDSIQYAVKENGPPPPIGQSQTTGQWLFGPAVTTTTRRRPWRSPSRRKHPWPRRRSPGRIRPKSSTARHCRIRSSMRRVPCPGLSPTARPQALCSRPARGRRSRSPSPRPIPPITSQPPPRSPSTSRGRRRRSPGPRRRALPTPRPWARRSSTRRRRCRGRFPTRPRPGRS